MKLADAEVYRDKFRWEIATDNVTCYWMPKPETITVAGLTVSVHRWLYTELIGPIRKPFLRPKCGTPRCLHPAHQQQSRLSRDPTPRKKQPGNGRPTAAERNRTKTHCPRNHEYTPQNTYTWTDQRGRVHRTCRRCKIARLNRKRNPR